MTLGQALAGRLPVSLAGLYCVLVTVVPVGFAPTAPPLAKMATWLCLLSLPFGLLMPQPRVAFFAGMVGVLGGATAALATALAAGQTIQATPLGVLGFFALALAWGALSSPAARQGAAQGAKAEWLTPRRTVSKLQVTLATVLVLGLPALLLPPLRLEKPGEATFALVVALGLILTAAPRVAALATRFWLRRL